MQQEIKQICKELRDMAQTGIVHYSQSATLDRAAMAIEWYDSQVRYLSGVIERLCSCLGAADTIAQETEERIGIAFEGDPDLVKEDGESGDTLPF